MVEESDCEERLQKIIVDLVRLAHKIKREIDWAEGKIEEIEAIERLAGVSEGSTEWYEGYVEGMKWILANIERVMKYVKE
ncbi:MAG: hypothetical protein DRO09_04220 [Thermoprotei archaeon]|nr:MAG: hypothetical protein DRO09_04220 [Thermoprotei archaeon]